MYVFMHKYFLIGNFYFELIYPDILTLPEHFMLFETDRRHIPADYRYQLSLSGHFPAPEGICIVMPLYRYQWNSRLLWLLSGTL